MFFYILSPLKILIWQLFFVKWEKKLSHFYIWQPIVYAYIHMCIVCAYTNRACVHGRGCDQSSNKLLLFCVCSQFLDADMPRYTVLLLSSSCAYVALPLCHMHLWNWFYQHVSVDTVSNSCKLWFNTPHSQPCFCVSELWKTDMGWKKEWTVEKYIK